MNISCPAISCAAAEKDLTANVPKAQGGIHSVCHWKKSKATFSKMSKRASELKHTGLCSCMMQD